MNGLQEPHSIQRSCKVLAQHKTCRPGDYRISSTLDCELPDTSLFCSGLIAEMPKPAIILHEFHESFETGASDVICREGADWRCVPILVMIQPPSALLPALYSYLLLARKSMHLPASHTLGICITAVLYFIRFRFVCHH